MMIRENEGKVFLSAERLRDVFNTLEGTACGKDCRLKFDVTGKRVDIEIRMCCEYTPCFLAKLKAMRTLN